MAGAKDLLGADVQELLEVLRATPARDPQAAARGRAAFLALARELRSARTPRSRSEFSRWALKAVPVLTLGLALACAGSVWASTSSLPGDSLYGLKTSIEETRVALSVSASTRAQLEVSFASRRIQELETLMAEGRYDAMPQVVARLEYQLESAAETLGSVARTDPVKAEYLAEIMVGTLQQQTQAIDALRSSAPESALPSVERAYEVTTTTQELFRACVDSSGACPGQDENDQSFLLPMEARQAVAANEAEASSSPADDQAPAVPVVSGALAQQAQAGAQETDASSESSRQQEEATPEPTQSPSTESIPHIAAVRPHFSGTPTATPGVETAPGADAAPDETSAAPATPQPLGRPRWSRWFSMRPPVDGPSAPFAPRPPVSPTVEVIPGSPSEEGEGIEVPTNGGDLEYGWPRIQHRTLPWVSPEPSSTPVATSTTEEAASNAGDGSDGAVDATPSAATEAAPAETVAVSGATGDEETVVEMPAVSSTSEYRWPFVRRRVLPRVSPEPSSTPVATPAAEEPAATTMDGDEDATNVAPDTDAEIAAEDPAEASAVTEAVAEGERRTPTQTGDTQPAPATNRTATSWRRWWRR